jgi:Secretion system C-terminal sorting domain
MTTISTNRLWKYIIGVFFIVCAFAEAQAQTPTAAIVPSGPIVCAGTKLDAVATNMTGPFTYQWSNGSTSASINAVQTGFYRVRIFGFNNGLAVNARSAWTPIFVIPATNATITPNGPTTLCSGQNVQLAGGGGQFFSSYLWNNGATTRNIVVNSTGTYTLTVTNSFGGCVSSTSASQDVTVYDSSYVPAINALSPIAVCQPGFIQLGADPGFGTYSWSTGASTQNISVLMDGSGAGPILDTLTVYLTVSLNNTCEFTNTNGLVIRSVRQPELTPQFCGNFTLTPTDSIRSGVILTYMNDVPQYEFEFEETTNPGVLWTYVSNSRWCQFSNVTPALQANKFYKVRVRAIINGVGYCYGDPCIIGLVPNRPANATVNQTLRFDGSSINTTIYPNPTTDVFKLVIENIDEASNATIRITDVSGRLINEYVYSANNAYLEFGYELGNGVYFVTVQQGDAKSVSRIIKSN